MTTTSGTAALVDASGVEQLATALAGDQALAAVTAGLGTDQARAVWEETAASVTQALADTVGATVLAAWQAFAELLTAAHDTREKPGSTALVPLAKHEVSGGRDVAVDFYVGGVRAATIPYAIQLTCVVEGAIATVRDAHLVAMRAGRCTVTVTLACAGAEVLRRTSSTDVGRLVTLEDPVPLLDDAGQPIPVPA